MLWGFLITCCRMLCFMMYPLTGRSVYAYKVTDDSWAKASDCPQSSSLESPPIAVWSDTSCVLLASAAWEVCLLSQTCEGCVWWLERQHERLHYSCWCNLQFGVISASQSLLLGWTHDDTSGQFYWHISTGAQKFLEYANGDAATAWEGEPF